MTRTVATHPDDYRMLVTWGGQPCLASHDDARSVIAIETADTGQPVTELAIPPAQGATIWPEACLETAKGTVLIVSSTTHRPAATLWHLRQNAAGRVTCAKLAVDARRDHRAALCAVGDLLVLVLRDAFFDVPSIIAILDAVGTVVHLVDEPRAALAIPVSSSAFAVTTHVDDEAGSVRVFDTQRLDWITPALPLDHRITSGISIGGHAVIAGSRQPRTQDELDEFPQIAVATLDSSGSLSPWQPMNVHASAVLFVPGDRDDAALLLACERDALAPVSIDGDLQVVPGDRVLGVPIGYTQTVLAVPGSIYLGDLRRVTRYHVR